MLDKNGVEIKTGCIVEITGAYFKNDNGLYFVENSPGDPSWCERDHSLRKIGKTGKISKAKYNICFWPISASSRLFKLIMNLFQGPLWPKPKRRGHPLPALNFAFLICQNRHSYEWIFVHYSDLISTRLGVVI